MNFNENAWFIRLGPRIWGPLTETQLKTMHRRGELTKVHQLSKSQVEWYPASELIASWNAPATEEPKSVDPTVAPETTWYYTTPRRERLGPVSSDKMKELVSVGQIRSETLVFGTGMTEWLPACQVPFLALPAISKKKRFPLWGIVLLGTLVCFITAVVCYFLIRIVIPAEYDAPQIPGKSPPVRESLETKPTETQAEEAKSAAVSSPETKVPPKSTEVNSVEESDVKTKGEEATNEDI